uniref:Ribosome recycling factor domain-containing protein n=1 Tax=Panagrolaimus sp. PS1159 TaxID=55785 RepID=A0AC35FT41_9BILA
MATRRLTSVCRRIYAFQPSAINKISLPSSFISVNHIRQISISAVDLKVRKGDKKKEAILNIVHAQHSNNKYVSEATKEMEDKEKLLEDELVKHFSTKVDLRVYEDIMVTLDNGEEHKMNRLGRVTVKSPQMVMINFSDNPTATKAAKLAIQKSSLNVNPQHEGTVIYIPTPRMTRERREELANSAKTTIFNDFKDALNDVFKKYDKKAKKEIKAQDDYMGTHDLLLAAKRGFEQKGMERIAAQQKELMKEVA